MRRVPVGAEPEGMAVSPDGRWVVCTSETTSLVHFIDARTGQVENVAPWPVSSYGRRPTTVKYRTTWITPLAIGPQQLLAAGYDGFFEVELMGEEIEAADYGEVLSRSARTFQQWMSVPAA